MIDELKKKWYSKAIEHQLEDSRVSVTTRPLKPEEALGKPTREGYALTKGKEVLIQAEIDGAIGHAFTDQPSTFQGSLSQFRNLPLDSNRTRAQLVATINATYSLLGLVSATRHCRDEGPELCGAKIAKNLADKHAPDDRILIIGFQPAIVYHMSKEFRNLRVTDNDADRIARRMHTVTIESSEQNEKIIESSDLILATGSTLVNGSIDDIVKWSLGKWLYFYGVTIAAATHEFELNRLCFEAL
jgi:hypothetical protein